MCAKESLGLYYWNTRDEILPGDEVEIKRVFRTLNGIVAYVPGKSPKTSKLKNLNSKSWLIRLPSNDFLVLAHLEGLPPGKLWKNIRLIRRGTSGELSVDDAIN